MTRAELLVNAKPILFNTEMVRAIKREEKQAKELGYVVVFGASDDLCEFREAIDDEIGAPGTICFTETGIMEEPDCGDYEDCKYFQFSKSLCKTIKVSRCDPAMDVEKYGTWTYKTDITHETFAIMEDGEVYGQGLVFDIKSL